MNTDGIKKPTKRILGLNQNVFFMGMVSFFNDFSNEMILSVFPAFFAGVLKAGAASLGMVEGIADGASQFIKIFSGRYSDKIQKRKLPAVLGYALSVAVRPFYINASTLLGVLTPRVIDRVGKGLREAPRDSLISLSVQKEELGKSFGFHRAMDTVGGIAGPLTAYLILRYMPNNFNAVFLCAFVIGLLAIFSFVFIKEVKVVAQYVSNKNSRIPLPPHFFSSLLSFFILSLGTLPVALMLLRIADFGYDLSTIPLFYLIYSVSVSIFSIGAGNLADKIGDRKVLFLGYVILLFSYFALSFHGMVALVISFVLLGLFSAFTDGIQRAYISRISAPEARGTAIGFLNGASGLGFLFAGIVGGLIWQNLGPIYAILVSGLVILGGLFSLYIESRLRRLS
ncbi:MAG: hypothetical protein A3H57_00485 [Candidatus Taylorbacteria bacterium RIFCSPLOWO2_02_FULL_43_11]|uniref:Major facilitator superfamily (MFS) profile domain-containing protein n=1 Tax=Candidatus Taylorbacteria bacterium RIFCSPHIGHO2_02_FULL_43_32b TaxID=1802306 RepID=A0A1G2MPB2_9BACT|nr:MAG: hypothetical protein A3C72_03885 [Candidatus Taylorbacteria bacterium RIFCSPHIGHO2_02_FULL_43_32b]OHA31919.1 MAG: hypothetical protein A3B08_02385 [Candidatus Taylorbacteria bacterium RIFCSPLOWO2_01_FULL_43_44]OHA35771.1 MAG: hypothetical protein A3H57_00485 [Candidatus Taylorbacteria bacterium RIFCSPLOWO2_02_FULL_43_11]